MLNLLGPTSDEWLPAVMADFDSFLGDHAMCEQKASANAMRLVMHYRDKPDLVTALTALSVEELQHFQQVVRLMVERGLKLPKATRDPYIAGLQPHMRTGAREWLLDRLVIFGIVEARGCERFGLIAGALPTGPLKDFYTEITRSEARHHGLFTRLARNHFPADEVQERLTELLRVESEVVRSLPPRAALH